MASTLAVEVVTKYRSSARRVTVPSSMMVPLSAHRTPYRTRPFLRVEKLCV